MQTQFLLITIHGAAIIPLDIVCQSYFRHLTPEKFARKVALGEIKMPIIRMEKSQKSAKGVHVADLAAYLDAQREAAEKEIKAISR